MAGPVKRRVEEVEGRRDVTVEYGLRAVRDDWNHRRGHVSEVRSVEFALRCRDQPHNGSAGDEEVVTRTIVTYTTTWTVVPGHEGSRWFTCWHENRPEVHAAAPGGHARPLGFRERDLVAGEDGRLRYTCPVCGTVWTRRDEQPAGPGMDPLF